MKFRRNLLARLYRNSDPDADSGGGGFADTPDPGLSTDPPEGGQAAPEQTGPASMLEAMFGQKQEQAAPTAEEQAEAAATGKTVQQLRDERGRFTSGKAEGQPDPKAPEAKPDPNAKPKEGKPDLAMPEGLTPKAQERFQQLANTNKELTTKLAEWEPMVQSVVGLQQVFQENGVRREQFEQAMQVVGLMNRGDFEGALAALDEQRKLISLHLGKPLPGANALADYPDLQQAVDNLQITEQHAMELARARMAQHQTQQHQQRQQQVQQTQQQEAQAVQSGQLAVDKFCKARMADDLDYARIEPLLLDQIKDGLLEGIPPERWAQVVQKTYGLIKQTASQSRTAGGATPQALRPTGGQSPSAQPRNAYEAMWGAPKPAGM